MDVKHPHILASIASVLMLATTAAADWPDYRGPQQNGHASVTKAPLKWDENTNIAWKTPIQGRAWSSPVILNDQIWVSNATPDGKKLSAVCLDLNSGKIIHNIPLFTPDPEKWSYAGKAQSHGSPSPVIEPGRVYIHFGTYGTACVDTKSGDILWTRTDINTDHYEGAGSSPVLWNDLLILTMDGVHSQYAIAVNKNTGKTVWKTPRSVDFTGIIPECRKAFSTPIIVGEKNPVMITAAALAVYGHNPQTGEEIWRAEYNNKGFSNAPRPVVGEGHVFISTGYLKADVLAVKLNGQGVVTDSHITWRDHRGVPRLSSPIIVDKHLYMVDDGGFLSCRELLTGKTLWRQRLNAKYFSSPVYAAGRIYLFDQNGKAHVIKPGPTFESLATNTLAEGCMASPAVIQGALIVRTPSYMYRIQE